RPPMGCVRGFIRTTSWDRSPETFDRNLSATAWPLTSDIAKQLLREHYAVQFLVIPDAKNEYGQSISCFQCSSLSTVIDMNRRSRGSYIGGSTILRPGADRLTGSPVNEQLRYKRLRADSRRKQAG